MNVLRTAASLLRPGARVGTSLPRTVVVAPGRGGLPRVLADSALGRTEVYLHGAHLTSWVPHGAKEVVFTSREAVFEPDSAIRGGAPLCLPWFASGSSGAQSPAHGWGRLRDWTLSSAQVQKDGVVTLLLAVEQDGIAALYEVRAGRELSLTVSLRNCGEAERLVEAAIHTYLRVGDVTAVRATGLESLSYTDKADGGRVRTQDGEIRVKGAVDRIYPGGGPVLVTDPALGRRLSVTGVEATDTVVWSPWRQGAAAFHDMADDEFASMLCVESARIGGNAALLAPGESVSVGTRIAVESL